MYLYISSMRKPSMGGRQHWVVLVDEATKHKKSSFLKKKNEQVQPIIDWIKASNVRELDLAMCFPIFKWRQDEKPLDQSEEVPVRNRQEP